MAYDEKLADRIREAFAPISNVEEKKMFRGVTFMVNKRMCVSVGNDEMMCRIDPKEFETSLERGNCRPMIHSGKMMRGFIFVSEEGYKKKKDFDYWIGLALDYNKRAKVAPKRKKK